MTSPQAYIKMEDGEVEDFGPAFQYEQRSARQDVERLVRSRLMENPVYWDLVHAKSLAWESKKCYEDREYEQQLAEASKYGGEAATLFFQRHLTLAEELDDKAKIFHFEGNGREPTMFDIGLAPGGFTTAFLKHNRLGHVFGITPHENEGGTKIVPRYNAKDNRVKVYFGELVKYPPALNVKCDLAICNGETFSIGIPNLDPNAWRNWCFLHSQLIWVMKRLRPGGRLVLLAEDIDSWRTIELLNTLRGFSNVSFFKSGVSHVMTAVFWIVASDVRTDEAKAKEAIARWAQTLSFALRTGDETDVWMPCYDVEAVAQFFKDHGREFMESAEPIWSKQAQGLYQSYSSFE